MDDDFKILTEPRDVAEWRILAHRWFDRLWRFSPTPETARIKAYKWLGEQLGIKEPHIKDFDIETCKKVISVTKPKVRGKKRVTKRVSSY